MRRFPALLVLASFLGTTSLSAQTPGDPASGRKIAQQWCASCHSLSSPPASDIAPSFPQIARNYVKTEDQLRAWLMRPHAPMPDYSLSRDDINDLLAFIRTLDK